MTIFIDILFCAHSVDLIKTLIELIFRVIMLIVHRHIYAVVEKLALYSEHTDLNIGFYRITHFIPKESLAR